MATECYSQLGFGFQPKLVVDFAGGTLTTDAGCCCTSWPPEPVIVVGHITGPSVEPRTGRKGP